MNLKRYYRPLLSTLVIFLLAANTWAQSVDQTSRGKLAPFFQQLLQRQEMKLKGQASTALPALPEEDARVASVKGGVKYYNAIIYTDNPDELAAKGIRINSRFPNFVTAQVRSDDLPLLEQSPAVSYVDPGQVFYPQGEGDVDLYNTNAHILHRGFINNTPYQGEGAIVLVFDTGIDWKHPDFKDASGNTRILYLWDQTLTAQTGEQSPADRNSAWSCCTEGVEYSNNDIDAGNVRSEDTGGHGTHVAGSAVGNNERYKGMAPKADLVVVKGGNNSFSEAREINAISYARHIAEEFSKPVVVNFSLGGQGSAHDGTTAAEQAIDVFSLTAGHAVVVAAGNEGGDQIHTSGSFSSGSESISVKVPTGYTTDADDYFYVSVWWPNNSASATAAVTSPNGVTYTRTAGSTGTATNTTDGEIKLYNTYYSSNGKWNVVLRVDASGSNYPAEGTWTVTLSNPGSTVDYHAWVSSSMSATAVGGNSNYTVGSPGTSNRAITVGSHNVKNAWESLKGAYYIDPNTYPQFAPGKLSPFSSIGPTADERQKPDLTAPGFLIFSSRSSFIPDSDFDSTYVAPDGIHYGLQGTSMATPHVAGAVALMMAENPALSADEVKSLLTNNARTDTETGSVPNNEWGYGKLDILQAFAKINNASSSAVTDILAYDSDATTLTSLDPGEQMAVRFSPTTSGRLSSVLLDFTYSANDPILGSGPLTIEAYNDNNGMPGNTQLGNTITVPFSKLSSNIYNYIDVSGMNLDVTAGTDFHIVVSVAASSSLKIRMDDGATNFGRTTYNDGSGWVSFGGGSTSNYHNLHMQAEVLSTDGQFTDIASDGGLTTPDRFELKQNYPNPFNPSTTIPYKVARTGNVKIELYDVTGRLVRTLVDRQMQPGSYRITVNMRSLSSGLYLYRMQTSQGTQSRKMLLIK